METIRPVDTNQLLNTAIEEARRWETPLGKVRRGKAEEAFEALSNGRIELGHPQAHTQRLRPKDFEKHGIPLAPEIKKAMRGKQGYAFYVLPVPVLLHPGRGAQYNLLESQITFQAGQDQRQPAIQRIFPTPLWNPVLDWGGKLHLALNGNLEWGAEVAETEVEIGNLSGELTGLVNNLNQLAGFIRIVPFEHTLGRMEIEAQFASTTAMWRLDSRRVIQSQQHVRFIVLLKVPKEVEQVQIEAAAQAEPSFDWLTAQIDHVFERLPEAIRQIVKKREGLPMQDFQTWTLDLAT
jgi:hypothetical protein